jgi:hypothetical protein
MRCAVQAIAIIALSACGFKAMGLQKALRELGAHCRIAFNDDDISRITKWHSSHSSFTGTVAVMMDESGPQPDAACIRNFESRSGYRFEYFPIKIGDR